MYKYYVIVSHDDNSIYMVIVCETKRESQRLALHFADYAFVVTVVSSDCYKYSDCDIVKRAKRKGIDSYA
ncbi:MAG: hypothetical protein ACI3XI_07550 [Eubacteriales bacterium]